MSVYVRPLRSLRSGFSVQFAGIRMSGTEQVFQQKLVRFFLTDNLSDFFVKFFLVQFFLSDYLSDYLLDYLSDLFVRFFCRNICPIICSNVFPIFLSDFFVRLFARLFDLCPIFLFDYLLDCLTYVRFFCMIICPIIFVRLFVLLQSFLLALRRWGRFARKFVLAKRPQRRGAWRNGCSRRLSDFLSDFFARLSVHNFCPSICLIFLSDILSDYLSDFFIWFYVPLFVRFFCLIILSGSFLRLSVKLSWCHFSDFSF